MYDEVSSSESMVYRTVCHKQVTGVSSLTVLDGSLSNGEGFKDEDRHTVGTK